MVRKIYMFHAPILKTVCEEVTKDDFNDDLKQLISDMKDTIINCKGVGLAAPQIGVAKRVIVVMNITKRDELFEVINPEITYYSKDTEQMVEGCLSFPKLQCSIVRPKYIIVKGLNLNREEITFEFSGLQARIFFHEIDHLNGISKIWNKRRRKL